jgi:AcrR family transcriptional regulator
VTAETTPDRRSRRRQETITEVIDTAAEIMAEQGVAGLSLGEVARRMGIRPPSLYGYFPSKHALYDALFEHGAQLVLTVVKDAADSADSDDSETLIDALLTAGGTFIRWSVDHPAYSQLLFWRPVPGFTPSVEAYRPAVEMVELTAALFASLKERGLTRPDASVDDMQRDWTVLVSGVISQQLSNAPHESFADGRFTSAFPHLTTMFAQFYGAARPTS